jgi:hypothetical protein
VKPLDIPCGVCHQPDTQSCVDPGGKRRDKPHAVRVAAAKRNNQPPHSRHLP